MAVLNVQDEFQSGDNVTATNLNNLVKDASFNADTTDNSTLEVHTSGYLKVKDAGVQTQHIGDDQVTYGKMQNVAANSVIGNPTSSSADPQAISISDLSSDIATELGNATTSADGLMSSTDKDKLDNIDDNANNYSHPTGDGNLHVPATGTTNNGNVLTAGSTEGSLSWTAIQTGVADGSVTTAKLANNAVTAAKITATDSTFNIDSSGNVGVGIAPDPNTGTHIAKLHVAGTGNTFFGVTSDTYAAIDLEHSGAGVDQKHWQMGSLSGSYEIRKMDDDLLGFTTPLKIDTNGDLIITGDIKKGGSVYGGVSKYDSGWASSFGGTTVANNADMTITHNLSTTAVTVAVYVNSSASDTNAQLVNTQVVTSGVGHTGYSITSLSSNSFTLSLCNSGYLDLDVTTGNSTAETFANKLLKVVVIG